MSQTSETGAETAQPGLVRERLALVLWAALVTVLPWLWRPGLVAPDTKLDLVTNPWGYLLRSLTVWDVQAGFGQLQNQAYGYLFPMGPVFGLGHSLGFPEWATQRLWWSLVLLVAFLGAERALRSLGVGSGIYTVIPALAYALSPRVLTVLSEISVEAWPMAICPWLIVVLVPALRKGASVNDRLRMAVATGLLMTAMGGVNAAASLIVTLAPATLLLTAPGTTRRLHTLGWWLVGLMLGSLWWMAPLFVLGAFAFPFLDFIETASVTTSVTSVPNVLRGTSHWVAYIIEVDRHPRWQSGWLLVQHPIAVVATMAVVALGTLGLVSRKTTATLPPDGGLDDRHVRRFALVCLLLGVALMTAGHEGRFGGAFAGSVREVLDGPLAAFRNVHKADPLVRLPLVIGLGWLLQIPAGRFADWVWPRLSGPERAVAWTRWVIGVVAVTLVGATLPIWQGRVVPADSYAQLPGYWHRAADLVDASAADDGGSTLLLPGSRAGVYTWGRPDDEPLTALASSPVMVRDAVSLGAPEATRILDVVDLLAASGTRQVGLAATLSRMGVARVVVRHDLAPQALAENPAQVERTLQRSPGFQRVARLGPGGGRLSIWNVQGDRQPISAYDANSALRVFGGPEAMATINGTGVEFEEHMLLVGEDKLARSTAIEEAISSDTLRLRRHSTGRAIADAYSQTLDDAEGAEVKDLPPAGQGVAATERVWSGLRSVRASDESSDPFAWTYRGPQAGAFAAIDGDPETSWLSSGEDDRSRLHLRFIGDVPPGTLRLRLASGPGIGEVESIAVVAGRWRVERNVVGESVAVPLAGATGSSLVIELRRRSASQAEWLPVGLSSLEVNGHQMGTAVRAAHSESANTATYVLVRDPRERLFPRRLGEDGAALDRVLVSEQARTLSAQVQLVPRPGEALEALLDAPWTVTASSRASEGHRARPGAALDGDSSTSWVAQGGDLAPRLELRADEPQLLASLALKGGDRKRVAAVELDFGGKRISLGPEGGEFTPIRTDEVTVTFRLRSSEGVFVSPELKIGRERNTAPVVLECGDAGALLVAGQEMPLRLETTRSALAAGTPVGAEFCVGHDVILGAGATLVRAAPGAAVQVNSIVLADPLASWRFPASERPTPTIEDWSGNRRSFTVEAGDAQVVAFHESFNPGWRATLAGSPLTPVRVDGWRQGFLVDPGEGGRVEAVFTPARWYAAGLAAGWGAVVLLLVAWLFRRRTLTIEPKPGSNRGLGAHALVWPRLASLLGLVPISVLLLVVGGLPGLLILFTTGIMIRRAGQRGSAAVAVTALAASGLAIVFFELLGHAQLGRDVAQFLGLVAVSALSWALVGAGPREDALLQEEVGS
jgi:arabinofuranan 3-O-arabinosyltransferase